MDKVTIIVPIYNAESFLIKCVESLLAQSYDNIEILLIDDRSTDNSAEIAAGYAEKYPDVCRFIQMEKNSGVSNVRNKGIEKSTGKWLAFVDSDDWVSPDYISDMYQIACTDMTDLVMCGCTYVWENGSQVEMTPPPITTESSHREKVAFCRCCMTAKLIRKQLLLDTGIRLPSDIHRLEELSVIVALVSRTNKISITHKSLYYYFQRLNSSSNQNTRKTDIEVFWKSVERMHELAAPDFKIEVEYHAICELLYGATLVMVKGHRTRKEIRSHIDRFLGIYAQWDENPYLSKLLKGKRVFIWFASRKMISILRLLTWGWSLKLKIQG